MIHFIDHTSVGNHHMVFNASIVKILMKMYPGEEIMLHGIASNQKSMDEFFTVEERKHIQEQPIIYTTAKTNSLFSKTLNFLRKEQLRKQHFQTLLRNASKDDLIFLSITQFTCFYYFRKLKRKFPHIPVIACLHGDLDFLYFPTSLYEKYNARVHRKLLRLHVDQFRFLLLNKIAKKILVKDGYVREAEVMEIEHPYSELSKEYSPVTLSELPIKVAHIGSMELRRKNSHFTYELAQQLKDKIKEQRLKVEAIGLLTPSVIPYKNEWVTEIVGNEQDDKPKYLTRAQYEDALAGIHFSLFFLPEHEYVFRASGAIVDTIIFEKPVITLRHPYFEYLFREAGNVGFMVESIEDMRTLLDRIIADPASFAETYQLQCANLKSFKEKLSIDNIAADLKLQIGNFRK